MQHFPPSNIRDVPFPVELRFDSGVRIVHIAAAGMYVDQYPLREIIFNMRSRCFFALDSKGNLYAWGRPPFPNSDSGFY